MQNEFLLLISYVFVIITIHTTTARRVISLPLFLFKLTFLSLGSLFVLHISSKRSLTVTLLLSRF